MTRKDRKLPHSNFRLYESVISADFPKVAKRIKLSKDGERLFAILVYTILQPVRIWIGLAIIITSGKRNLKLNRLIFGSTNSEHLRMMAVDFYVRAADGGVDRKATEKVFYWIKDNLPHAFGQLILYRKPNGLARFIHVSLPSERYHGKVKETCHT